ncbi:YEATS domain-containing protein 4-like [Sycon ciliatum]|uniref:YEATS domain-containing protein 4-like n=1 Tax=Sycon ciliatum TaxID=27933 RepID=UPI0031F5FB7F|eukprot:scpid82213/ scgid18005/ YEATS domain-containing protein 4; Glioma-amplified sequence 41; NuMA-binding protein 1
MADQDGVQSSSSRMKGTTIVKPILIGNTSRYFGKKREEDGHTHSWTVYVKPYRNEDMSIWVKRVQFKLHDSYPNPTRIVTKPPYEVTESGWGEFEINVKIFFNDANEKPVNTYHLLKLFHSDATGIIKKHVVSELYDEIIFTEPTHTTLQLLTQGKIPNSARQDAANDYKELEEVTLERIAATRRKIDQEIAELRASIQHNEVLLPQLKGAAGKSAVPSVPQTAPPILSSGGGAPANPLVAAIASSSASLPAQS